MSRYKNNHLCDPSVYMIKVYNNTDNNARAGENLGLKYYWGRVCVYFQITDYRFRDKFLIIINGSQQRTVLLAV